MLDLRQYSRIKESLEKRSLSPDQEGIKGRASLVGQLELLLQHTEENRELTKKIDNIRHERKNFNIQRDVSQNEKIYLSNLKNELRALEKKQRTLLAEIRSISVKLPNILAQDIPVGKTSSDNVIIRTKGEPYLEKHHFDMNIFENVSEISGSKFILLSGKIAQLENAINQFMLKEVIEHGFTPVSVPSIINREALLLSGHINDVENMYKIDGIDKYLIPTSEFILVQMCANKVYSIDELPVQLCASSSCYRREAGAAGADTKGLVRVHEFKKVEMVSFTMQEASYKQLDKMLNIATSILDKLLLPYRVVELCSGDIGKSSAKTFDIEVSIGGVWREVASISNCEDYQSMGLRGRYESVTGKKEFLHTLNGSALAVGRTLASILEVFYTSGTVRVPEALHSYLNFTVIENL